MHEELEGKKVVVIQQLSPNKGDMRVWSSDRSWKLVSATENSVTIKPHGRDQLTINDTGHGLRVLANRG